MVRHFNFSPVFCPSDKVKSPQSLGRLFSICKIKPEKTTHQRSRRKRDAQKGTPPEPQRWGKRQLLGRADDTRPRLCHTMTACLLRRRTSDPSRMTAGWGDSRPVAQEIGQQREEQVETMMMAGWGDSPLGPCHKRRAEWRTSRTSIGEGGTLGRAEGKEADQLPRLNQ